MDLRVNLDQVTIILHKPRYPENIGAAVRAMQNMGLSRLRVVQPENYKLYHIKKMATHACSDIVDRIEIFDSFTEAVKPFGYIAGTTARTGGQRFNTISPGQMAREIIPLSINNQVAVLFGPEDRGLTNEELRVCQSLVTIPTAFFTSLNLAQSVMVISYELFQAGLPDHGGYPPRLATQHELTGMYDQLKDILVRISYINPQNPDYWLQRLRRFFTRMELRKREVSIIRGIIRQVNWYGHKCFEDGKKAKDKN